MLRHNRRRSAGSYTPHLCAAAAALSLLLLSLSVLHSRLSSSSSSTSLLLPSHPLPPSPPSPPLSDLIDAANDAFDAPDDDLIDVLDSLDDPPSLPDYSYDDPDPDPDPTPSSFLFFDHSLGVSRLSFGKPGDNYDNNPQLSQTDRMHISFASDDQVVGDAIQSKIESILSLEDALVLKTGGRESSLRKGWAHWLEGKGDFLRRDRMLRSNLEFLNPKNHPLLQDPDGVELSNLSKGDRMVHKILMKELSEVPFIEEGKKRLEGRKTLKSDEVKTRGSKEMHLQPVYADGRRWGYFPGLEDNLTFSEFMARFLEQCSMKVFMVWNSPSWMYGVRNQRGLESLLRHHKDACVVVFSETIELNFFQDFLKDGFKIGVVMANLDELLKDTPAQIFASVWFEWRKTKHYPIHYSELIRLAALYKYGGIYLDSDIIVLKPIHHLKNAITAVSDQTDGSSTFSGAVMAFEKNSTFILECLKEFYSTYDEKLQKWNGADLLARVMKTILESTKKSSHLFDIQILPTFQFYPVLAKDILRYFAEPADETEAAQQEALFARIINESFTFHLWSSLTSAFVPEPKSLVYKILDQYCIHCLDVL